MNTRPPATIPLQHVRSNVMASRTCEEPVQDGKKRKKTRFVCMSDTHNLNPYDGGFKVPKGDVLLHAGDMTKQGAFVEVQKTVQWIGRLVEDGVVERAIIIAGKSISSVKVLDEQLLRAFDIKLSWTIEKGNHDLTLDPTFYAAHGHNFHSATERPTDSLSLLSPPLLPPGVTFLNHTSEKVRLSSPNGPHTQFTVFGSPYTPVKLAKVDDDTTTPRWAFQYPPYPSTESEDIWNAIPTETETDVLITHGPPYSHLEGAPVQIGKGVAATSNGCEALRQACWRVRPSLHVFGHVHDGRGAERVKWQDSRHVIGMEEGCACSYTDSLEDGGSFSLPSDTTEDEAATGSDDISAVRKGSVKSLMSEVGSCTHDHAQMEWRDPGAVDDRINGKMSLVDVTARTRMFGGAGLRDGETLMVNASIRRGKYPYRGVNKVVVVDIDLESSAAGSSFVLYSRVVEFFALRGIPNSVNFNVYFNFVYSVASSAAAAGGGMGIPHLLLTLEKLRRPETKSFSSNNADGRPSAVIDGSALAHFVFNCCVKTFSDRTAEVLAFDYAAYQRAVVQWLDNLEAGFTIGLVDSTQIFVDGHLPSYKTDTRTSRIQSAITDTSRLRTLSPAAVDLRKSPWTPTPPFLIAAFTDAVCSHERYRDVIRTVPGEADAFCAGAACEGGRAGEEAVIFTADSDLLVYPCIQHTRVALLGDVLFEDIQPSLDAGTGAEGAGDPNGGLQNRVKVTLWSPAEIDRLLGGEGNLLRFAWVLHHETARAAKLLSTFPSTTVSAITERGKLLANVSVSRVFREQYTLPPHDLFPPLSSSDASRPPAVLLDSRVAEVVYRSQRFNRLTHPQAKEVDVTVYLPVLLEDVAKKSAWNVGLPIRRLAYSLLFNSGTMTAEACRKAAGVTHRYITLHADTQTADAADKLAGDIAGQTRLNNVHPALSYAVQLVITEYSRSNSPLDKYDILALLAAITPSPATFETPDTPTDQWTWARAHLLAQLYAGLWSIYLLQTALTVAVGEVGSALLDALRMLQRLVDVVDARRFIAVYALMPRVGKKARKRARKRVKMGEDDASDDEVQGVLKRLFGQQDRQVVLSIRGEHGSGDAHESEGDRGEKDGGVDDYTGMTVG
ncbi:rhamnogalacturonate lyase [Drechslerella dactyloides]|uniref:Rhamnogalacturonate lyase n=1 Tax=Drechslerella dactyloides TaxID=74499 RepID=A0AAD6NIW4_DREDA|nr:rhamnogalacturonate lyase [Drechslerella dactyloides]